MDYDDTGSATDGAGAAMEIRHWGPDTLRSQRSGRRPDPTESDGVWVPTRHARCTSMAAPHVATALLEQHDPADLDPPEPFRLVDPARGDSVSARHRRLARGPHSPGVGRRTFDLGAPAARWADKITNPPSRADKLGIKPGLTVLLSGVSDVVFRAELERHGVRIVTRAPAGGADLVFVGAERPSGLTRLERLRLAIKPNGAIWVVRPKGRSGVSESAVMLAGKQAGLVDVKVVSFSDTHTAEKFVIPVARRLPAKTGPKKGTG